MPDLVAPPGPAGCPRFNCSTRIPPLELLTAFSRYMRLVLPHIYFSGHTLP
jgi:hypothetical protein